MASEKLPGGLEKESLRFPKRKFENPEGFPRTGGVLASEKPPGGLENEFLAFPKRGFQNPGGVPGGGEIRFDTWERTVAFSQRFGGRFGVRKAPGRP